MMHDEALAAFITESRELLEHMETALLQLEQEPLDAETINAVFRAAHTIKGSAGIFGLDHIVRFTHVAESVLDCVRAGKLDMDPGLCGLLLRTGDHLSELIDLLDRALPVDPACSRRGDEIRTSLNGYLQVPQRADDAASPPLASAQAARDAEAADGQCATTEHWHLSLRFHSGTFVDGFDPLSFIRYLGTFGEIVHIVTLVEPVPALSDLTADDCHLGFEIAFRTDADQARIESAFEFVRQESRIRILPPHSKVQAYLDLIGEVQDPALRLGEILVRCGSLSQTELDDALDEQTATACMGRTPEPLGEMLVQTGRVPPVVVEAALTQQASTRDAREVRGAETQFMRVDAAKLDQLINLIGELVIAGAGAALVARQHRIKALVQATSSVSRLMEEVRDSALNLRMVQIGGTFNRFQRVVRDVSQELGKDIALKISGAETELDKTVVERLADPLTHLVRNAMDHGIECADVRMRAGKPQQGTVRLHAYHEAGSVVVEVSDDGGGLNKARILSKAVERGLVLPDAALSDQEIYQMIFEPGFSTAEQVSNLSGRGVGMDVVKRNITALRGSIDIRTQEGQGTTIAIRLPLTLAIIDGFMMGIGSAIYVVPLDVVVECIELRRDEAAGRDWLDLRGEVLPLVRLRDLYDVDGAPGRRQNVVVVRAGNQRVGLVVDQLMGELQTVIKPLGKVFHQVRGISGFTILGNGAVALLLDVPSLLRQASVRDEQHIRSFALTSVSPPSQSPACDAGRTLSVSM